MNRKLAMSTFIVSMVALTSVAILVNETTATPPSGLNSTVIASGDLPQPVHAIMLNPFKFNVGADFDSGLEVPNVGVADVEVSKIVVAKFMIEPGGTSGWHQHGGPGWIVVRSGDLTITDESCKSQVYPAGSSFLETGSDTHKAVNLGNQPVEVYATFMLPKGGQLLTSVPAPRTCS